MSAPHRWRRIGKAAARLERVRANEDGQKWTYAGMSRVGSGQANTQWPLMPQL